MIWCSRGGRVVDGSGLPSYLADVAIKNGKIVEVGRVQTNGSKTIDVDGLVVSPGFIDHHTHMDAQIQWDPYGTAEPHAWHYLYCHGQRRLVTCSREQRRRT